MYKDFYHPLYNYFEVRSIARNLLLNNQHVWKNNYNISYVLPSKFSIIFYSEYGAYADREYILSDNIWSRSIESTHCLMCGLFCLLALEARTSNNYSRYLVTASIAMGSQLMNSLLYLINYYYQCEDSNNVNYNTPEFPTGEWFIKRPFMYINILWTIMPLYSIMYLMNELTIISNYYFISLRNMNKL